MKIYIGTSGWTYDWNPDGFRWYAENANLNAVELNASFYRFPFPNQIKSWIKRSKDIRWAIKVHRSITHYRKFSKKSLEIWQKFYKLFKPMDELIDFWYNDPDPDFKYKMIVYSTGVNIKVGDDDMGSVPVDILFSFTTSLSSGSVTASIEGNVGDYEINTTISVPFNPDLFLE